MPRNILIKDRHKNNMGIYERMKEDWQTYCLMSSIIYVEEMHKPLENIQIKRYKKRIYKCKCFGSTSINMVNKEFLDKFLNITKKWENKLKKRFIGEKFNKVKIDKYSGQYKIILTPTWLGYILKQCGKIPNKYSFESGSKRINAIKQKRNEKVIIDKNKFLYSIFEKDKFLAAGAFIISMDLECRGVQTGEVSLCMSEKYKDFLDFMLKIAKRWNWTNNKKLSLVSIEYSKNIGIMANPQYEFRINMLGLKEIYALASPLAITRKDRCVKFHIERSNKYKNLGYNHMKNNTKMKIFKALKKNKSMTSTDLQFIAGVKVDVVLDHLHNLENERKIKKIRVGKGYIWSIK